MNASEWTEWTKHHKSLFALRSDDDAEMVARWHPMLVDFSLLELREASNELVSVGATYRDQHVSGLLRILATRRSRRIAAFAAEQHNGEQKVFCGVCNDRGFVDVPHPACILDGEIVEGVFGCFARFATVIVFCKCARGANKLHDQADKASKHHLPIPMTLIQYEQTVCGHWQSLMVELDRAKKAKQIAMQDARWLDKRHGRMKGLEKIGTPKP